MRRRRSARMERRSREVRERERDRGRENSRLIGATILSTADAPRSEKRKESGTSRAKFGEPLGRGA